MRTIKLLITLALILVVWLMFCTLENISPVMCYIGCFVLGFVGSLINELTKDNKNV